jgi:hypothetical protein
VWLDHHLSRALRREPANPNNVRSQGAPDGAPDDARATPVHGLDIIDRHSHPAIAALHTGILSDAESRRKGAPQAEPTGHLAPQTRVSSWRAKLDPDRPAPDRYPARNVLVGYLERYAATIPVEIQTSTRVATVRHDEREFSRCARRGRHQRLGTAPLALVN